MSRAPVVIGLLLVAASVRAADAPTPAATIDTDIADEAEASPIAVALVPLGAGRSVTTKQAAGVQVLLRGAVRAVAREGTLKLLPTTKDDDKAVRRCMQDVACYSDIATARGADVVVYGVVEVGDGGLRLVARSTGRAANEKSFVITGDSDATAAGLDRLARELLAPDTLRGTLAVTGQPGDVVVLDGQRRGTIGEGGAFALERLREGAHPLEVSRPAGRHGKLYEPFTRDVAITHRQTTSVKIVLLPREQTATLGDAPGTDGPPTLALVSMIGGSVLVAGGVTVGVFSLLDGFEVEKRAEAQQLVFPRDEALVSRGRTLAVVANVLYGAGLVTGGAGLAWWLLSAPPDETAGTAGTAGAATAGGGR